MNALSWCVCGSLLSIVLIAMLPSSRQDSFSLASPRCLSICRRDEESLCKRCLFREPMRFGKRTVATFREPMRFGKKADYFREPMQFGKRKMFREPMRFGKRQTELAPDDSEYLSNLDADDIQTTMDLWRNLLASNAAKSNSRNIDPKTEINETSRTSDSESESV